LRRGLAEGSARPMILMMTRKMPRSGHAADLPTQSRSRLLNFSDRLREICSIRSSNLSREKRGPRTEIGIVIASETKQSRRIGLRLPRTLRPRSGQALWVLAMTDNSGHSQVYLCSWGAHQWPKVFTIKSTGCSTSAHALQEHWTDRLGEAPDACSGRLHDHDRVGKI